MPKKNVPKNGSVAGKVIDSKTKEPIPYATIVIKDMIGKTITGGITSGSEYEVLLNSFNYQCNFMLAWIYSVYIILCMMHQKIHVDMFSQDKEDFL